MFWFSSHLGSGPRYRSDDSSTHASQQQRTESIRAAVLELLTPVDSAPAESLYRRVRYAADAERLWHLRGDVMSLLASRYGEVVARQKLQTLGGLFREVLPAGLASQLRADAARQGHNESRAQAHRF